MPDNQLLLSKNVLTLDGEKLNNDDIESLLHQQPNTYLLGIPLRLHLYNLAKPKADTFYLKRLQEKVLDTSFSAKLLSKKQYIAWNRTKIGFNSWLKSTGEAPTIIDTSLTKKSIERLSGYYASKGYFNNSVTYEIDSLKKDKRGQVTYKIERKDPYVIDSISLNILSKDLDSIYKKNATSSLVKEGDQFDLSKFQTEQTRLTQLFRNNGVYNFQESSIVFDIHADTLQVNQDFKMPVTLNIANATRRVNNNLTEVEYEVHKFNNINLYIDSNPNDHTDTVTYGNYTLYYKNQLKYRPKALTDALFLNKDSVYRDIDYAQTLRQLNNLQAFRYPNIQRVEDSVGGKLNADIYLHSKPKFSLGFNTDVTHSSIQDFGIAFSTSLISRNIFRGAETLEISARGSLGSSSDASGNGDGRFFNVNEIGGDIRLTFPRMWFPFNTEKIIPKRMSPNTRITLGTSVQENIGLDKQTFNNVLQYNWNSSSIVKNIFELINVEYVRNVNPSRFFDVYRNSFNNLADIAAAVNYVPYDENTESRNSWAATFIDEVDNNNVPGISQEQKIDVQHIEERRQRLSENNLIFATNFTYTKNNREEITDDSFSQFRVKLESAGNLLTALAKPLNFDEDSNGDKLLFGVKYSQYFKTELDYIKHWRVGRNKVLAFRGFTGIAIPYGNSNSIPFSRSYFGGGSNDNRAWEAYSLGPGSTGSTNDFNEANLKLAFNLEYRFDVFGDLKGALFADAGNIWNVFDNVEEDAATFDGFSSLKDIALGTGFGLRYDFSFFVLRFDTGFKTYNPAHPQKDRWFKQYNFSNAVFNIGINYPF